MTKAIKYGLLILAVALLSVILFYRLKKERERSDLMNKYRAAGQGVAWEKEFDLLRKKLSEKNKSLLNKKYYYINIWAPSCAPCIKEMPWLDSIAGIFNTHTAYIFLSKINEEDALSCINKRNYHLKNFVFLNNMNEFVTAIFNKKGGTIYPTVIVLNSNAEIIYYSTGAYENIKEAEGFTYLLQQLE